MTAENQSDVPPPAPRHLDARQLEVWRALRSKAKPKFPFHDWYSSAIGAVSSSLDSNPDRLAQAGNSLREILEKLPRAMETEVQGPDRNTFMQARSDMAVAFAQAKEDYSAGWNGEISEKLTVALRTVDHFVGLRASPTRAERTFIGLTKLDPMLPALPGALRQRKRRRYTEISNKLEGFTHHQCEPDDQDFRECLEQTEDLILDLLAPITAEDQDELFAIIAKGAAVTDDDIVRSLRLIERRGANFAFFFENLSDAVWLLPLENAGYFKEPTRITPAGEGLVAFPVWWPMVFLRRVAAKEPEHVVEILLKIDATDNPRVLDGLLEIAAEVPVEYSIRLEGRIRDYINQPYHV